MPVFLFCFFNKLSFYIFKDYKIKLNKSDPTNLRLCKTCIDDSAVNEVLRLQSSNFPILHVPASPSAAYIVFPYRLAAFVAPEECMYVYIRRQQRRCSLELKIEPIAWLFQIKLLYILGLEAFPLFRDNSNENTEGRRR